MDPIITMLLASQPGTGFSSTRWLEPWGRTTLLDHMVSTVSSWPVPLGLVVLGHDADRILDRVDFGDVAVLVDPEWQEGEAASLRAGLDYLQRMPDVEAVLLADGDSPHVAAAVVSQLVNAHLEAQPRATAPKYRYTRGRPIVLGRDLWPRFLGMEGSARPEAVLATHGRWVEEVWLDELPPRQITTPEDLTELAPRR